MRRHATNVPAWGFAPGPRKNSLRILRPTESGQMRLPYSYADRAWTIRLKLERGNRFLRLRRPML